MSKPKQRRKTKQTLSCPRPKKRKKKKEEEEEEEATIKGVAARIFNLGGPNYIFVY